MDSRSYLFVPGDQLERVAKAAASAADAVIVDLEDGVGGESKQFARDRLPDVARSLRESGQVVAVRINGQGDMLEDDLLAACLPDVDILVVPKVSGPDDVEDVAKRAAEFASARALAPIPLIALIEDARGVLNAGAIAASANVCALALGSEDFSLSLRVKPSFECLDLPARTIALAASAWDKAAIALPISIAAFRDEDGTRRAAMFARAYGVRGALCIHPLQVAIVNDVFRPSSAELDEANAILSGWAEAQARGEAVTTVGGRMVDAPVVAWAQQVLRRGADRNGELS